MTSTRHQKTGSRRTGLLFAACLVIFFSGCGFTPPADRPQAGKPAAVEATGIASYYGRKFHGRKTASGERFDMYAMTAAHPRFAFGTKVRVTSLGNGRSVTVRINDRGPFVPGRIIDLSYAAARKLGMLADGLARVKVEVVPP
jgi:rare lipoprotein A